MDSQKTVQDNEKKGGKTIIAIGVIAIMIIAVLIGMIIYLLQPRDVPNALVVPETQKPRDVIVAPENVQEVIEQMEEDAKTMPGTYEVSMNTQWRFPDGKSASSNAFVENSTSNTNMVYFTVTLEDGDEEVYHSPYMEVGSQLTGIQLDKELAQGEYDAVITYYLVDDDFNDLSHVSMAMSIIIEQ